MATDPTKIPTPPVPQKFLGLSGSQFNFETTGWAEWHIMGALDQDYFLQHHYYDPDQSGVGTSWVRLWRMPVTEGVPPVMCDEVKVEGVNSFANDPAFYYGSNDAGLVIGIFVEQPDDPEQYGLTYAQIYTRVGRKIKVIWDNEWGLDYPNDLEVWGISQIYVSEDSKEFAVEWNDDTITGHCAVFGGVGGDNRFASMTWTTKPPKDEYPYEGRLISLPEEGKFIWENTSQTGWSDYRGVEDYPFNHPNNPRYPTRHSYAYGFNRILVRYPENAPDEDQLKWTIAEPYRAPSADLKPYGEVRASTTYHFDWNIPDYRHGQEWDQFSSGFIDHADQPFVPTRAWFEFNTYWHGPSFSWYTNDLDEYDYYNDPTYLKKLRYNCPLDGTLRINGVPHATGIGYNESGSGGMSLYPRQNTYPYIRVWLAVPITIPEPGPLHFEVEIDSRWPTLEQSTRWGLNRLDIWANAESPFWDTQMNSTSGLFEPVVNSFYGYHDPPFLPGPSYYYGGRNMNADSTSIAHVTSELVYLSQVGTFDHWYSSWEGFPGTASALLTIEYDSSNRGGGFYELRAGAEPWNPNRLGPPPMDTLLIGNETMTLPVSPNGVLTYGLRNTQTDGHHIAHRLMRQSGDTLAWHNDVQRIPVGWAWQGNGQYVQASSWKGQVFLAPSPPEGSPA